MSHKNIPLEELAAKLAGFGVPSLMFTAAVEATGFAGAAAVTAALSALGPGGMIGGLAFLGVSGLLAESITKYGANAIYIAVIKQLYKNGETKESIKKKIYSYPVSKGLKLKLFDVLQRL